MKPTEIIEIIYRLNCELWDNLKSPDDFVKAEFVYTTNGFVDIIKVADIHIWNSDDDLRYWDSDTEEYEDLEIFLKKEYNKLIKELSPFKI